MKINFKNKNKPFKIIQKKYFDKRGYFQEIYLNKIINLDIKFTAIAKSKKKCNKRLAFSIKESAV